VVFPVIRKAVILIQSLSACPARLDAAVRRRFSLLVTRTRIVSPLLSEAGFFGLPRRFTMALIIPFYSAASSRD
jgi:hypothetical protein